MLELNIRELEIGDEVIEGLEHLFNRQRDQHPILNTQTIQVSEKRDTKTTDTSTYKNSDRYSLQKCTHSSQMNTLLVVTEPSGGEAVMTNAMFSPQVHPC